MQPHPHAEKLNYTYNIYNCLKHLDDKSFINELSSVDDSAYSPIYIIAKQLLLDNVDNVVTLLNKHFPKDITPTQLLTWPIFVDFRTTKEFNEFKKTHQDKLEFFEVE